MGNRKDSAHEDNLGKQLVERRNYQSPVVQKFGQLSRITQVSGGNGRDANNTMTEPFDSGRSFCGEGKTPDRDNFVLQFNMSNPREHCNLGFENWCLDEGRVIVYSISLGEPPLGDMVLRVSGEYLQYSVDIVFTVEDYAEPHEITLVFIEDTLVSGNYWMKTSYSPIR